MRATLCQHLLHIADAQVELGVQPDRMPDGVRREATTLDRDLADQLSLRPNLAADQNSLRDNAPEIGCGSPRIGSDSSVVGDSALFGVQEDERLSTALVKWHLRYHILQFLRGVVLLTVVRSERHP